MSFASLLIHLCTIQGKTLSTSGYEKVQTWGNLATNVPCRYNPESTAKIEDTDIRVNTDDDTFFFGAATSIERGNRIVYEGKNYDVIKVGKIYDSTSLHHLEVRARLTDNK